MSLCNYSIAWRGFCGDKCKEGRDKCEKHDRVCDNCGNPATGECDQSILGLICGAPLCDDCGHDNPMGLSHKAKTPIN